MSDLEAPPPTATLHCRICMEDVPSISIFKTTKRCDHSFCSHCVSSYIAAKIKDGVANVRCPGLDCKAMLDPVTCKQLVTSIGFARWCDLLSERSVLGLARCCCPNSNCREMIINECGGNGGVKRFKCPSCKESGRSRFRDLNIRLLERLAKRQQWKRCPQCHIYVERRGGCKNIVCRCGTLFCYGCGQKNGSSSCACRKVGALECIFTDIMIVGFIVLFPFLVGLLVYLTLSLFGEKTERASRI